MSCVHISCVCDKCYSVKFSALKQYRDYSWVFLCKVTVSIQKPRAIKIFFILKWQLTPIMPFGCASAETLHASLQPCLTKTQWKPQICFLIGFFVCLCPLSSLCRNGQLCKKSTTDMSLITKVRTTAQIKAGRLVLKHDTVNLLYRFYG